jgi:hypothetical protein
VDHQIEHHRNIVGAIVPKTPKPLKSEK